MNGGSVGVDLVTFIRRTMANDKIPFKCKHCGYVWEYSGRGDNYPEKRVTCGSCGLNTKLKNGRLDGERE